MKRPRFAWAIFALCVGGLAAALAWLTGRASA